MPGKKLQKRTQLSPAQRRRLEYFRKRKAFLKEKPHFKFFDRKGLPLDKLSSAERRVKNPPARLRDPVVKTVHNKKRRRTLGGGSHKWNRSPLRNPWN